MLIKGKHGLVRSKEEFDLSVDPSPELVIEIDVTSTSIHKDPIYAQLGIREVWRYDGNALRIGKLVGEGYVASETSDALPLVTATVLSQFLERSRAATRPELVKSFRQWIRENSG